MLCGLRALQRAVHIHPAISELIPTMPGELKLPDTKQVKAPTG